MLESGILGNIYPNNTGYINICFQYFDVKLVKMQNKDGDDELKLVVWDKRKEEIKKEICVLIKDKTDAGKIFFKSKVNLGFGMMEIKVLQTNEEKRKDENSAIMFILGTLMQREFEYGAKEVRNKKERFADGKEYEFTEVTFNDLFE